MPEDPMTPTDADVLTLRVPTYTLPRLQAEMARDAMERFEAELQAVHPGALPYLRTTFRKISEDTVDGRARSGRGYVLDGDLKDQPRALPVDLRTLASHAVIELQEDPLVDILVSCVTWEGEMFDDPIHMVSLPGGALLLRYTRAALVSTQPDRDQLAAGLEGATRFVMNADLSAHDRMVMQDRLGRILSAILHDVARKTTLSSGPAQIPALRVVADSPTAAG